MDSDLPDLINAVPGTGRKNVSDAIPVTRSGVALTNVCGLEWVFTWSLPWRARFRLGSCF